MLRVAIAALGIVACSGPALAFKNLQACDIVMFETAAAPSEIAAEAWLAYRDEMVTLLSGAAVAGDSNATQGIADRVIEAQNSLLAPITDSDAYKDYLAGGSCLVLRSLTAAGIDAGAERCRRSDARDRRTECPGACQRGACADGHDLSLGALPLDSRPHAARCALLLLRRRHDPGACAT